MRHRSTLAILALAAAAGIRPDPVVVPSAWAAENVVVADGPRAGERWSANVTPFWVEMIDNMAPQAAVNRDVVRKSAQIGFTGASIAVIANWIANAPAACMTVQPTVDLAKAFNREKLQPTIEASPALRSRVREVRSRSEQGSTTLHKQFPGGFLALTGANSAAGLRAKTIKYVFADEIDEWPLDLEGQGSPRRMVDARQMAFRASGDWKRLEGSTPTIEGESAIDELFEAGDQRFWHVPCPHCGHEHVLTWEGLQWDKDNPEDVGHACPLCGAIASQTDKPGMVAAGRWIATNPGGAYPSRHVDTLMSPFVTWADVVRAFLEADGNTQALKTFWNLWLGRAFKIEGEAPEHERLYKNNRAEYRRGELPPGVLFLTSGVDVQQDRLETEIVGWGVGRATWSIDYRVLEGDTAKPEVWTKLAEVMREEWRDWQGNIRQLEATAVDASYRPQMTYQFTRGWPRAIAIRGVGAPLAAALGTPSQQTVRVDGKRPRRGKVQLWPVGTWQLKAELYGLLNLEGPTEDNGFPTGWCAFPQDYDEEHFKRLVSERLVARETKGFVVREWHLPRGARNEQLDCRVYATAAAHWMGMGRWSPANWAKMAADRGAPPAEPQLDLLEAMEKPQTEPAARQARAVGQGRSVGRGRSVS